MKRSLFALLAAVILMVLPVVDTFGATSSKGRVLDFAGLYSQSESSELAGKLKELSTKLDMDAVIIAVDDEYESYKQKYGDGYLNYVADDLLDESGYSNDNICLIINKHDNGYAISYEGAGIKTFNKHVYEIEDAVVPKLSSANWTGAVDAFADKVSSIFDESGKFKFGQSGIIAVVAGLIAGLIRSGSLKSQLKSVASKSEANNYIKPGSFKLNVSRDIFLYRKVTTRQVRKDNGPETHKSASGDTHGGTHGTF